MTEFDPDIEPQTVYCERHGEVPFAAVCRHLFDPASGSLIYHEAEEDQDDSTTDARCIWCADCDTMLQREGDWTEAAEAFADPHLVCVRCVEELLERHGKADQEEGDR